MSDLEHRIEALEKANRRWRYAALSLVGILLIALVSGGKPADDVPDLLQARRIEVLRPDGKPGIVLQANDKGSGLSIRAWAESNKDRDPAVVLEANKNGSGLSVTARSNGHQRAIALGAHEEGVRLMLMKHKEAPLLIAEADDDGSSVSLFDGREPTQNPRSISLGTRRPTEVGPGGTGITLSKGGRKDELRAGLFMTEPTETTDNSYLFLGGPKGRTATGRVNQQNGKLEFVDENNKAIWSTP
jgi:hypothetical protein